MASTPRHIAIVMDGNGRWAERRNRPRYVGHQAGVKAVRRTVEHCAHAGVEILTLFAFSSENWQRPPEEVRRLLNLFTRALHRDIAELHDNGVRLRFVGNIGAFSHELQDRMREAERQTADNERLTLNIAVNYGGRWDLAQAARRIAEDVRAGRLEPEHIDEAVYAGYVSLADQPEPDLLIRTGGNQRLSNFLLWQLAYTELYFTDCLWPDFGAEVIDAALDAYSRCQRRFGRTGQQVAAEQRRA